MSAEPRAAIRVRPLTVSDLPEIMPIERSAYEFPWSEGIFRDCLRVGYRCHVATDLGDRVMGYSLLSIAAGEAHVLNLCVDPQRRRQGVASLLLENMMRVARKGNAETIMLEVRPSNKGAIALYYGEGFERVGVRRRYYPAAGGREDAMLLSRVLV